MKIEIWSDVVCPWCYVGKRRFETALAQFEHADELEISYRAFELDPSPDRDKHETEAQMLARKFGQSIPQAEQMLAQMTQTAAAEGLEFHYDTVIGANTFLAHQLIALADEHGVQPAMKERLMKAHFTEGEDVGELETLVRLGSEIGLGAHEVRNALASGRYAEVVRAQQTDGQQLGITGVPFFVIDRKYGISGAQAPETHLQTLERAWTERDAT